MHGNGFIEYSLAADLFSLIKLKKRKSQEKIAFVLSYCLWCQKLIDSSKSAVEILEKFFERLQTWYLSLEPRYSIASRIEFRVETVNLLLHGTVHLHELFQSTVEYGYTVLKFG